MAKKSGKIFQLKVTLKHSRPPIWRRIQVPGDTNLGKLHDVIQIVMGWTDSHLHVFKIGKVKYGVIDWDDWDPPEILDGQEFTLDQVLDREGQIFSYMYDFGDSWDHTLTVEKILSGQSNVPICLEGKRAGPPEDVGGIWGYENFLEVLKNPTHPEYRHLSSWGGKGFDPEKFDLEGVNEQLRMMGRGKTAESNSLWPLFEQSAAEYLFDLSASWAETISEEHALVAQSLPLRRDVVSMMTYLRDHKVTGTQSTGNFPLRAVREICAQFIEPPELDTHIGEQIFKLRSETEVRSLQFRHLLAAAGGLISGGLGRRWTITRFGEEFLEMLPAHQVWILACIWWLRLDWGEMQPFGSAPTSFPYHLYWEAANIFLKMPVGKAQKFTTIADKLIKRLGLVSDIKNEASAKSMLHAVVWYMILEPQKELGIFHIAHPEKEDPRLYSDRSTFELTSFGFGLLEALKELV